MFSAAIEMLIQFFFVDYTDWFLNADPALLSLGESHLVMMWSVCVCV